MVHCGKKHNHGNIVNQVYVKQDMGHSNKNGNANANLNANKNANLNANKNANLNAVQNVNSNEMQNVNSNEMQNVNSNEMQNAVQNKNVISNANNFKFGNEIDLQLEATYDIADSIEKGASHIGNKLNNLGNKLSHDNNSDNNSDNISVLKIMPIFKPQNSCGLSPKLCGISSNNARPNGNCHGYGLVDSSSWTLPCNRQPFIPFYVHKECTSKAVNPMLCPITYQKCVKRMTCSNPYTCNYGNTWTWF